MTLPLDIKNYVTDIRKQTDFLFRQKMWIFLKILEIMS